LMACRGRQACRYQRTASAAWNEAQGAIHGSASKLNHLRHNDTANPNLPLSIPLGRARLAFQLSLKLVESESC